MQNIDNHDIFREVSPFPLSKFVDGSHKEDLRTVGCRSLTRTTWVMSTNSLCVRVRACGFLCRRKRSKFRSWNTEATDIRKYPISLPVPQPVYCICVCFPCMYVFMSVMHNLYIHTVYRFICLWINSLLDCTLMQHSPVRIFMRNFSQVNSCRFNLPFLTLVFQVFLLSLLPNSCRHLFSPQTA
jgi:hypothetical protein